MQQLTLYREPGRFAGWPANYGIWAWGQEVVVGYTVGYYQDRDDSFHARDESRPFLPYQSRSLDGGQTWDVRPFPGKVPGGEGLSSDEHLAAGLRVHDSLGDASALPPMAERLNFRDPNLALMFARSGLNAGARSWFYFSQDRCHTWNGPFDLPTRILLPSGEPGIAARTDYLIDGPDRCTLFLTSVKSNGKEGRVFCARMEEGGTQVRFVSWVTPEPEGYAIMPASVRLSPSHLLCAVRFSGQRGGPVRPPCWIDLFQSHDDGATWRFLNRPVEDTGMGGNPPTLTQLQDGRLLLTYGYRNPPYAMCAILSEDDGETWSEPITLRTGGGNHDIGYPRTAQLADGNVITAYYWNDAHNGERYIAATLWKP